LLIVAEVGGIIAFHEGTSKGFGREVDCRPMGHALMSKPALWKNGLEDTGHIAMPLARR